MANDITIQIKADDDASAVIKKLKKEINALGDTSASNAPKIGGKAGKGGLGGALGGMTSRLAGFAAAAGPYGAAIGGIALAVKGIVGPAFSAAREVESLKAQLKAVQGTAEGAEKRFQELSVVSKEITGLDLNSLIKYDNVLQTVGLSGEESATVLRGLAEAGSQAGLSADRIRGVTEQLSQAFASNKVASEDLKTVWRELPAVQTVAKDLFGETAGTIEGLRETFKLLGIDARTGLNELFAGVEKVSEIDVNTFNAQWEMFSETMSQWQANLGGGLVDAGTALFKVINDLTEQVEAWFAANFSGSASWHTLVEIIKGLKPVLDVIIEAVKFMIKAWLAVNPVVQIIKNFDAILGGLVDTIIAVTKVFNKEWADQLQSFKDSKDAQIKAEKFFREEEKKEAENAKVEQERIMGELKTARSEFLASAKDATKMSFDERRQIVNEYFTAQEERIKNLAIEDTEQKKLLKENAEQHKTSIENINKDERKSKADQYKNQLTDAQAYYADLKRDENTSVEDLKAARLAVYHYNKQVIELTETDETKKKEKLAKLATDLKNDVQKIEDDKVKYNQEKRQEEIKAEEDAAEAREAEAEKLREEIAKKNKLRSEQTFTELQNIVNKEGSTLQERINKNNQYYGFLMAEAANRITDETEKAIELEKIERERINANTKLEKDFATEQDNRRKAEEEAQKTAAKAAEERAKELTGLKISELNKLEEEQLGVIDELDRADDTSVEARIEAVKKLYGIRLAKLNENKDDNKNWAADKQKLENDLKNDIAEIVDEDKKNKVKAAEDELTEKKRIAKERLDVEQDSYNKITESAESSADDINEAAEDLYDAKLAWIELNVEDEEEAARQILQAQKELDEARINSIELFFKRNQELLGESVDIAIQAAETIIGINKAQADAERDIKADMLKAEIDFQTDRSVVIAEYSRLMVEARAQAAPQIQAARDRGDDTEANRLQAELDRIIGMTSNGQLILDEFGNMQGLAKQQSDALQEITDTLNGASRDYFGALREIEAEAKQQQTRGFWDTIGNIADFGLEKAGEGIGAFFGSPEAGRFLGDIAGDLAQVGTTAIGDIQVGKLKDEELKRAINEYRTQAARAAQNASRGMDRGALTDLFEGTDFDPEVIAERQAEAEEKIRQRTQELYEEEVRKLNRLTDAKKRIFDKAQDDESKTVEQIKDLYQDYHDRRKLLLELTIQDEGELKDQLVRLSWERTDAREAIDEAFERRAEERRREQAKKTVEEDKKTTDAIIDSSDKVTRKKKSNADKEVENMKESYEQQVQLTTEQREQIEALLEELSTFKEEQLVQEVEGQREAGLNITHLVAAVNATKKALTGEEVEDTKEALDTQVKDTQKAGLNITHIIAALNAQKEALLDKETGKVKESLDTQVASNLAAGLNITHIVGALNAQKKALMKDETEKNKESLDEQEKDTKTSALNITHIVAALNAQKEALSKEYKSKENKQSTEHYDALKAMSLDWAQYIAQQEGFTGVLTKARLDNTLDDYREFFTELKSEADEAYSYINSKIDRGRGSSSNRRSEPTLPRGFGELFHDPVNDAMAYIGGARAAGQMASSPAKRQNAQDFTEFFSAGMMSKINQTKEASSGGKQPAKLIFEFSDGVMKEVAGEIQQLENDRRSFKY